MLNPNPCKHAVAAWAFACFLLGLPTAGWNVPSGTVICQPKKINYIIHCTRYVAAYGMHVTPKKLANNAATQLTCLLRTRLS